MQVVFDVSHTTYCETSIMNKEIMRVLGMKRREEYIRFLEPTLIEIPKINTESPEDKKDSEDSKR